MMAIPEHIKKSAGTAPEMIKALKGCANNKHFEAWLLEHRRKHKRAFWIGRYAKVDVSAAFKAGVDYQRSLAPKGQPEGNHAMDTETYYRLCRSKS